MEPNDPLIKHWDKDPETGEMVPVRFMSAEEIKERADLQMANNSERMRNRVLAHHAKGNGYNGNLPAIRFTDIRFTE